MKLKNVVKVFGVSVVIFLVGCASIMHGTTQQIGISSNPTGAKVTIGGQSFGTTPTIADLKRKDNHIVQIELNGYLPFETTLTKKVSGWVWGNILFGGLIGLAVDTISGGLYKLTPGQIQANLAKEGSAQVQLEDDALYVFVTLTPDPSWEKIGQMARGK